MFGRLKKSPPTEQTAPFEVGDEVYIHTGPNKWNTGIVQRIMPVMMEVKLITNPEKPEVIRCKHSSARLSTRTVRTDGNETGGQQQSHGQREPGVISDESVLTLEGRDLDRKIALEELKEAVTALEVAHQTRMQEITALIRRLELLG